MGAKHQCKKRRKREEGAGRGGPFLLNLKYAQKARIFSGFPPFVSTLHLYCVYIMAAVFLSAQLETCRTAVALRSTLRGNDSSVEAAHW